MNYNRTVVSSVPFVYDLSPSSCYNTKVLDNGTSYERMHCAITASGIKFQVRNRIWLRFTCNEECGSSVAHFLDCLKRDKAFAVEQLSGWFLRNHDTGVLIHCTTPMMLRWDIFNWIIWLSALKGDWVISQEECKGEFEHVLWYIEPFLKLLPQQKPINVISCFSMLSFRLLGKDTWKWKLKQHQSITGSVTSPADYQRQLDQWSTQSGVLGKRGSGLWPINTGSSLAITPTPNSNQNL